MKRRQFCFEMTAAGAAAAGFPRFAGAQLATPVEGTHYARLGTPVAVSAPQGKIDVVEFFSYACPHCNLLEPVLESWVKRLPSDVVFRRAPVPFLANAQNFQRIYFALEAMNLVEAMQMKVFNAVHVERQYLDKPDAIGAFMLKNGVDSAKFMATFNSFGVQAKARQATQLAEAFKVESVPSVGVHGRFYASGQGGTGGPPMLAVVEHLIQRVRSNS